MTDPTTPEPAPTAAPAIHDRRRLGGAVAAAGALLLALILWGVSVAHERRRRWEPIPMPERLARVLQPWPVQQLAQRLHETGKVRDTGTFLQAAAQVGLTRVAAGGYRLPAKAGPLDLASIFKAPPALLKVTFPEGWTGGQMAARLKSAGLPAADAFRSAIYPVAVASPYEGRLFPDTYYLPREATAPQLIDRLQGRFQAVAKQLPKPFPSVQGVTLTLEQVVTLASLVERETDVPEERPLVAGVLLNRLQRKMRLQCDATVQYILERSAPDVAAGHKVRLLYRDLKVDSPYNTYRHAGLPPGAICNPGAASLAAAAAPRASNYLFYVMSDKLGRHRFAATLAEHDRNRVLSRAERK